MKKLCLLLLPFFLFACDDDAPPLHQDNGNQGGNNETSCKAVDLGINAGRFPQQIIAHKEYTYFVASGDNVISRFKSDEPSKVNKKFIDRGENANPYHVTVYNDVLYGIDLNKKGYFTWGLALPPENSGVFINEVEKPQAIAVNRDGIFIVDSDYDSGARKLHFRSSDEKVKESFEIECENPTGILTHNDSVLIIGSGKYGYDSKAKKSTPGSGICVEILKIEALRRKVKESEVFKNDPKGLIGGSGNPLIVGDTLFMGSGTAPVVFAFDLKTKQIVRGTENPIVVDDKNSKNSMTTPVKISDEQIAILDQFSDNVYYYDIKKNKIIRTVALDNDPDIGQGPIGGVVDSTGKLRVLTTLSQKIYEIQCQ